MKNADPSVSFGANERVLVIGLGRSGRASVNVLRGREATVFATDEGDPVALVAALDELREQHVDFVEPHGLDAILPTITAAVVSPGIPLNGALVRRIQNAGVPVFSEVEVAYRICKAPIVAVTGTKGKTTTTALIGALFRGAGKTTHVGGNIGNALIAETAKAAADDWVIAEVSSFQLESIRSFKPRVSLILNVSPDHLDRYHSMDEYTEAKFRVFANQNVGDTFVGSLDDPIVASLAHEDNAARIRCRALWYAREPNRTTTLYVRHGMITYAPPTGDPRPIEIMPVSEIPLLGQHNLDNVLGAILVGLAANLEREAIRASVGAFRALSHRLQTVAEIDGVTYVDDSKATNPGAVIAALRSFEAPIILIAGGRSKGTSFEELGRVISSRTKGVVLIGEDAEAIGRYVKRAKVENAGSMRDAVAAARAMANPGDVILLSPGCASFDMFTSAEDRGERFIEMVGASADAR